MTFDEIMKQALGEAIDERLDQMLTVTPKPKCSLSYKLWKRKTLRDFRQNNLNKRWALRKSRYVMTAIIAIFSLLIGTTAYAAIAMIGRYAFVDKIDYSKVLIEKYPSGKTTFEEYYELPEDDGWEIIDRFTDETWRYWSINAVI